MENVRTISGVYTIANNISIDTIKNKVKVSQLDIDDHGSVIPLKKASERPRRKPLNMAIATSAVLLIAKSARNNPQERSNI
jgi:hypothetical protein